MPEAAPATTRPAIGVEAARTASGRPWLWRDADERGALVIAQRHGLPEVVARLLAGRGVGPAEVARFLEPRVRDWLPDPSHLLDLDRAVERLAAAVTEREPVGIVTDYDVDGASAAALVALVLRGLGVPCRVLVPDRMEHGYGPHPELLARLAADGIRLVLVLDSGTTAFEPLRLAREQGLEVVVVDHHSDSGRLPPALAVVNPNRHDQTSPVGHLAAVGVTFLLLVGLLRELRARGREEGLPDLLAHLDLVALGTVCDVVPLEGLNRAFVGQGLKVAARGRHPGLAALAGAAGLTAIDDAWHFGFALGPRLNAGGRLGRSGLAVALLTETDPARAAALAAELDRLNRERQQLEQQVLGEAERLVAPQLAAGAPLLFACGRGWHPGVVGIVAGRLLERYGLPVFVLAAEGEVARGSARSVPGLDIGRIVLEARARGILREGGGHPLAAGATVALDRLAEFEAFLVERAAAAADSGTTGPQPLVLDGSLGVTAAEPRLAAEVARLGPFGAGNPEPRFALLDAVPVEARVVGRDHVACLLLGAQGRRVRGIAFRAAGTRLRERLLAGRTRLWLAGRLARDDWRGEARVSFRIEDAAVPDDADGPPFVD